MAVFDFIYGLYTHTNGEVVEPWSAVTAECAEGVVLGVIFDRYGIAAIHGQPIMSPGNGISPWSFKKRYLKPKGGAIAGEIEYRFSCVKPDCPIWIGGWQHVDDRGEAHYVRYELGEEEEQALPLVNGRYRPFVSEVIACISNTEGIEKMSLDDFIEQLISIVAKLPYPYRETLNW